MVWMDAAVRRAQDGPERAPSVVTIVGTHAARLQARNGVCDEGWGPNVRHEEGEHRHSVLVRCDLGTDCSDCGGAWAGHLPGKPIW